MHPRVGRTHPAASFRRGCEGCWRLRWKVLSRLLLPLLPLYAHRAPGPIRGLGIRATLPEALFRRSSAQGPQFLLRLLLPGPLAAPGPALWGKFRGARVAPDNQSSRAGGKLAQQGVCVATPPTPQKNKPKGHHGQINQRTPLQGRSLSTKTISASPVAFCPPK